jgi:hypothetical protein
VSEILQRLSILKMGAFSFAPGCYSHLSDKQRKVGLRQCKRYSNLLAMRAGNPYSVKMKSFKHWLKKHWVVIFLIVIILALFFTIRYFIYSLEKSYTEGELHTPYYHHRGSNKAQSQSAAPEVSINDIQAWMTFDYVNVVFKLPKDYLKNILGINDARYPNIRIDRYGRDYHIDQTVLLTTIKKYITTYTDSASSPQATSTH